MKRSFVLLLSLLTGAALLSGPATAAKPTTPTSGVHFTSGGDPTCTLSGGAVSCEAELAGLGQGDIVTLATVQASATYTCQNHGGQVAPGQNRVTGPEVGADDPTVLADDEIINGRVVVADTSGPATVPATVGGRVAGCPNGNWTGINPVIVGYDVHFESSQGGTLLFCREGTSTTADGSVALTTSCGGVAR